MRTRYAFRKGAVGTPLDARARPGQYVRHTYAQRIYATHKFRGISVPPQSPPRDDEIERLLPLRPVEFHVLLSLASGPRHGYGIMQDAAERTGEEIIPDVGTLYRALRRMVDRTLIEPSDERSGEGGARRNDYRITPLGRRLAEAESRRLASLVRAAQAGGFLESEA